LLIVMTAGVAAQRTSAPPPMAASRLLTDAIAAQGGEDALHGIRSVAVESMGHAWALEQSERPEGPWLSTYSQASEVRDYERHRRWTESQVRNWVVPDWSPKSQTVVADGVVGSSSAGRWAPGSPGTLKTTEDLFALSPERLLLTAKAAADLHSQPDVVEQRVTQHVLAFSYRDQKLRLFLNAWTHLPTMLEIVGVDPRFSSWGDVTYRRWYSDWRIEKSGVLLPRQVTVDWNGFPYSDTTVHAITVNGQVDEAKFAIPEDTRKAFAAALARPAPGAITAADLAKRATDVADGIVQIAAGFNVEFVRQPDGIVVIEAVNSSAYSAAVLDFAKQRFPGLPIKALVTTSDAWPHLGGIREYVARGIPIYPLDLNVSILTRMANAPYRTAPDALAKAPRAPIFRPVSQKTVIGTGDTRIELYPVRNEIGERMMLAWLPGAHLLYSSDLIQHSRPGPDAPFYMPMMLAEAAHVVEREHITGVERVFGMHLTPTPWSAVVDAITAARGDAGPAIEPPAPAVPTAVSRLDAAIAAMGGESRLTHLKSLQLDTIGHTFNNEQSERPEGPWLTTYNQNLEIRDFEHSRRRMESQRRNWSNPLWSVRTATVTDGKVVASTNGPKWIAGFGAPPVLNTLYALAPERLLLTAREAKDLQLLPDAVEQKVNQHVIGFSWNGQRLRLYLNAWTNLPTMLEITRNETRFARWGDVTDRRWYSFWTLEKGGLMYPRQTSTEWNGFPYSDETVQVLKVDEPLDESLMTIPDDARAAYLANPNRTPPVPTGLDPSKAIAISDWLVELPSGFNVSIARQPDGLVIFEATTSNDHADAVMAFAASKFPGVPIKAVVTTSDAWPHIGGIRRYVAKGIPIYALDLNVSILTRFVNAPHTFEPDVLSKAPKAPIFRPVSSKTVIGTGASAIELIPVRGETGERMMLAWFPSLKVLYTSDLIQRMSRPTPDLPFFDPEMLAEVQAAAAREKVEGIDKVFGMHLTPTPWSEVTSAIAAARK
jgi:hypothetical protein